MTTERAVLDWLHAVTRDGVTHEEEIKELFLDLEELLYKKGLLRSDFKTYKSLLFNEFCDTIYEFSTH